MPLLIDENISPSLFAKDLIPVTYTQFDRYTVYRTGPWNGAKTFARDNKTGAIIYYLETITEDVEGLSLDALCQNMVWRCPEHGKGIAEEIFFSYVLPENPCIVSDLKFTRPGMRFWNRLVMRCMKEGATIAYIDHGNYQEIRTSNELIDISEEAWGTDVEFYEKRFVIYY